MAYRKNMRRVFISVPMNGRTEIEIFEDMSKAMGEYAKRINPNDTAKVLLTTDFIHNHYVTERIKKAASTSKHPRLIYLAEALRQMASCDEVIFAGDWEHADGCCVERLVYERYFEKESSEP